MALSNEPVEAGRLINLIPVALKEAAIDSPTSRASIQHMSDQVDLLERWLDEYLKATNRLVSEHITLENVINNFTAHAVLPTTVSETMLDHDYSVLAMRKYAEGAKDYWMSMVTVIKKLPNLVCEPIRQFQATELKVFKDLKRAIEGHQKNYDSYNAKFMAVGRNKEPSALREDAFQLHELRKVYLRSVMDLFQMTPQFRFKLDKLLVRIFCDSWKEMRQAKDNATTTFQKNAQDMDRVRGWVREMEDSEHSFQRELATARKQLEEEAELNSRPARELDDYAAYSMPGLTAGHAHSASTTSATLKQSPTKSRFQKGEKSGWLFLRTYYGKPTRIGWVKRWAFVRNGVFGWLVQNARGGVEESERIGVLLCALRPAPTEERRFCFELKTNKNTIMLQAETQSELAAWIAALEAAKEKAVNDPSSSDKLYAMGQPQADPAFAISPPPIPEFGTNILASTEPGAVDDPSLAVEKSNTLPIPGLDDNRQSFDVLRRATNADEGQRDHASRIMSKLDLHRRNPTSPQMVPSPTMPSPAGGIGSLIAASTGSLALGAGGPMTPRLETPVKPSFTLAIRDMPPSTLAPSTLANTPTPTSLSKAAVIVSGERGIRGGSTGRFGIPNSILANTWGTSNSSYVNRFDPSELRVVSETKLPPQTSPSLRPEGAVPRLAPSPRLPALEGASASSFDLSLPPSVSRSRAPSPTKRHRNTISFDKTRTEKDLELPEYPTYYPLQLKTQDAQFRLLFPNVRREERLTMVFRATWNPSGTQDFPGRAYVTTKELYFYSNHFGLVLTSGVSLASIDEVTAAPGKDCDFLFVHFHGTALGGPKRITIKTFLEPLKLLQRRLNFLATNSQTDEPQPLEEVIKTLLKMETEVLKRSASMDSWEDVSPNTPADNGPLSTRPRASTSASEFRGPLKVDGGLYGMGEPKTIFKLPSQPVKYIPPGYNRVAVEREYDVSAKALFHVMFGDRSVLWQLLQHERRAKDLKQGPWLSMDKLTNTSTADTLSRLYREFSFLIPTTTIWGNTWDSPVKDYQTVDVVTDHLCYVITDRRTPWHLPFQNSYRLVSKIIITHVAKTKCKLAIFTRIDWSNTPFIPIKNTLERHALVDLDLDAQDLADLVADQVRKLGHHSRTKKALQVFGQLGHSTETTQLQIDASARTIEMRRQPRTTNVITLLSQDILSVLQSYLGTALQGLLDIFAWLNKTVSAHSFILSLLLASALYNSYFTLRDSWEWYHERNAARFVRRLGIQSEHVMVKAVHTTDLEHAMAQQNLIPSTHTTNMCFSQFNDEFVLNDLDFPVLDLSTPTNNKSPQPISIPAPARLRRTRQNLASQRHDLLVAMRVVNSIEREAVRAEWEKWVVGEARRCRIIEPSLVRSANMTEGEVAGWYEEYCRSCGEEVEKLKREEGVGVWR